ncbi:MAG: aminotransferase class V-fold PLP-dependent enzyme [Vicinamibacterales bacterium]
MIDRIADHLRATNVQLGASYAVSERAGARMQEAQQRMAAFVNAGRPEEVVMGPTSTQLVQMLARAMAPQFAPGDEVVVTRADHESNIGAWVGLESVGVVPRFWEFDPVSRRLELDGLARVMSPRTKVVAFTHASNIFGTIHPVAEITRFVHDHGAKVCVDGVAYAPHRLVDVAALDVDFYVLSLYKVYGPHHALLYGKYQHLLELAGQYHYFIPPDRIPYKLQPGNPNYELSWGSVGIVDYVEELGARVGASADAASSGRRGSGRTAGETAGSHGTDAGGDGTGGSGAGLATPRARMEAAFHAISAHEEVLARRLLDYLATKPRVRVVGEATAYRAVRVPTISFTVDGVAAPDIVRQIDPLGIGIRYGDFHSRRLVDHLGLQAAGGVVRVSMVHYNTVDEIDRLIAGLDQAMA